MSFIKQLCVLSLVALSAVALPAPQQDPSEATTALAGRPTAVAGGNGTAPGLGGDPTIVSTIITDPTELPAVPANADTSVIDPEVEEGEDGRGERDSKCSGENPPRYCRWGGKGWKNFSNKKGVANPYLNVEASTGGEFEASTGSKSDYAGDDNKDAQNEQNADPSGTVEEPPSAATTAIAQFTTMSTPGNSTLA